MRASGDRMFTESHSGYFNKPSCIDALYFAADVFKHGRPELIRRGVLNSRENEVILHSRTPKRDGDRCNKKKSAFYFQIAAGTMSPRWHPAVSVVGQNFGL
ncbi:unnamed protein product, partial [Iphiclides podalirius]